MSLFSGTLRSNLDPFNEHTDAECWDVLERCHLTTILKGSLQRSQGSHEISLDMPISQTGSLSAGERQLVAMARAILRRSNLVILDEATSQIDTDLDDQVSLCQHHYPTLIHSSWYRYSALSVKSSRVRL